MKVLLTGANGFVGSRILAGLQAQSIPTAVLLRPSSRLHLIEPWLAHVEIRTGEVGDPASLDTALQGITHVLHCAGKTKVLRLEEFHAVNAEGTRHLVQAANRCSPPLERFVHLSSLAAIGPALPSAPAREDDLPHPVSEYGRSKLRSEEIVQKTCRAPFLVLRPPGVYGPGDSDFLQLFRAVRWRICPQFGGGQQPLSLVFVDDLAEVMVACMTAPLGCHRLFHVAHPQTVTASELAREVARQSGVRTLSLPLSTAFLTPLAAASELVARLRGRPPILGLERRRELQAPGWVCDVTRLQQELGLQCRTGLSEGIDRTLAWYRQQGWL